jgi:ribose transport system ATP-binding protein
MAGIQSQAQPQAAGILGSNTVLEISHISKSFPGVKALDDISFSLAEGEILGLVGENGAGKSTMVKIISGVYQPDEGEVIYRGECLSCKNSLEAAHAGIGMVHQELSLLPNLTVAENIYLGRESRFLRWGRILWKKMFDSAQALIDKIGVNLDPRAMTSAIPFSARQMVELARVLSIEDELNHKPVIILDEPTTTLSGDEIQLLFKIMRNLAADGYSLIFISHRLEEIFEITRRIIVLKDGVLVGDLSSQETQPADLQRRMVGRELQHEFYRESGQTKPEDQVVLEVKGLFKNGLYKDVNFSLHKGEILGLAGVQGSGIRQLSRTLFGALTPDKGAVALKGEPIRVKNPREAIRQGIGYIPEERGQEGLVLYFNPASNITLPSLHKMTKGGVMSGAREAEIADKWIKELRIKVPTRDILCNNLSGGNQQKVIIAKWLESDVDVWIMDHPTRGIDVGAKEEIYAMIRELTDQGVSVILIADSLEELIGLSSNILVMKDGEVQTMVPAPANGKPTPQDLIQHMI